MIKKYAVLMTLCLLCAAPAWAHKVCLLSAFEGDTITGEAYFSTGDPVVKAEVLIESNGAEVAKGTTSDEGGFSVPIPAGLTAVRVTINAGMGHVVHEDLTREDVPSAEEVTQALVAEDSAFPPPSTVAVTSISQEDIRKAVAAEIAPVKHMVMDISKAMSKPDLPRILGGIGYIIGIVGAFLWGKARRGV